MRVDVIVPAYNPGVYLREALLSCMNQSYKDFTITVVDDCSTDDVKAIVDQFPSSKVKYIRTETNLGPSGARNVGIKATSGELISLLDSDDIWEENKLLHSVAEFKKDSSIGMTCGNYRILVNRRRLLKPFYSRKITVNWKSLMRQNFVACGSVTMKRSVLDKVGLFDENLWIGEDADLWLRISEEFKIKYIHKILYYYAVSPGNSSLTQRDDINKDLIRNIKEMKARSRERMRAKESGKANTK